jgi:hypothetical protein
MAVSEGRNGKITVVEMGSTYQTVHTVAELGTWSISGFNRDMIEYTAFGDTVKKWKPGMLDGGTITFTGFYDGTDSTGQVRLVTALSSGGAIGNSTAAGKVSKLRLWANDDPSFDGYGFWSCTGSAGQIYITTVDLSQDKNGLGTISFTAKVSKGELAWSTST